MSRFLVNGTDLDLIFLARGTGTGSQYSTNFIVNGQDLQLRYAGWSSGVKASDTKFITSKIML